MHGVAALSTIGVLFLFFVKVGRPTIRKGMVARNTVRAPATAPSTFATSYPMNPTVITTGPGVIMATALVNKLTFG